MWLRKSVYILSVLSLGLRLRCPACGLGRLFEQGFHMRATCPYCRARFERARGESAGGTAVNAVLTLALALGGFFVAESLWHPPIFVQLIAWLGFAILFSALCYRASRGLWVSVAYLTGGVHADRDYERDYVRAPGSRQQRQDARNAEDSWY